PSGHIMLGTAVADGRATGLAPIRNRQQTVARDAGSASQSAKDFNLAAAADGRIARRTEGQNVLSAENRGVDRCAAGSFYNLQTAAADGRAFGDAGCFQNLLAVAANHGT